MLTEEVTSVHSSKSRCILTVTLLIIRTVEHCFVIENLFWGSGLEHIMRFKLSIVRETTPIADNILIAERRLR